MHEVVSAAGVVSLLEEDDQDIKSSALERLDVLVDAFWAEISESIRKIESLHEDVSFKNRERAALIASRVYYHLGRLDDSMEFALGARELFDVNKKHDSYVDTIIAKCIDTYKELRLKQESDPEVNIDKRLEDIVERMFDRCFSDGEFRQGIGIAMESRRLDKIEEGIIKSGQTSKMITYCFDICVTLIMSREFRQQVLRLLVKLYLSLESPDFFGVTQCLMFLGDYEKTAEILANLLKGNDDDILVAYQIAFDLHDKASQFFLRELRNLLPSASSNNEGNNKKSSMEDVEEDSNEEKSKSVMIPADRLEKIHSILSGQNTISLHVDFLYRHNQTDITILKNIKGSFERNAICHSATIMANAYMHAGTTVDQFLRDNLEWLGRASNWAKFGATASLGVIHKGQIKDSLTILKPYLPQSESSSQQQSSVYSEGGALFALGIIHSNHGDNMTDYLLNIVKKDGTHHVVQHGACLGLGLAAMATGKEELYDSLTNILFADNAVAGEAAAVAIGLVMLGAAHQRTIEELRSFAQDTSHEKIIRGIAIALALTMYGREEEADTLIDELIADKDPILRYGAMYTIGLAYCGTSNNSAIRKLLQIAVSDVSDDVRRAAVMNLGFLLFKNPKQCPRLVSLLAESYNPHVRYGVSMALAISCAGTGLIEAVELLETLINDPVDFVRQGALMALSMVLIQFNEHSSNRTNLKPNIGTKVKEARKKFESVWGGREEIMTKMGAILASGIIDAGGRNVNIMLHKNGHNKMRNIVGLALFTQHWFWYPYLSFLSLAFEPTAMIGVNHDLKMPKYQFKSNAKPSLFAYPAPVKAPEKQTVKVAQTAELSLTAKAKARDARKKRGKGESSATTPTPLTSSSVMADQIFSSDDQDKKNKKDQKKNVEDEEPQTQSLHNPARVTPHQLKYITFDCDTHYEPLKFKNHPTEIGIVLLKNLKPGDKEEIVEPKSNVNEDNLPEPEPPEAFEYP